MSPGGQFRVSLDRRRGAGPAGTRSTEARSVRMTTATGSKPPPSHLRGDRPAFVHRGGSGFPSGHRGDGALRKRYRPANVKAPKPTAPAPRLRPQPPPSARLRQLPARHWLSGPRRRCDGSADFGETEKRAQQRSASSGSVPLSGAQDLWADQPIAAPRRDPADLGAGSRPRAARRRACGTGGRMARASQEGLPYGYAQGATPHHQPQAVDGRVRGACVGCRQA